MAIPASGIESTWRNNIDEVVAMLNTYHAENFMIWNLSELTYNYDKFQNCVIEMGFPDHHNPPLDMLFQIIVTIEKWLSADAEHVAIVHCKGGKGRTGTVVACYLLYSGVCSNPLEALELFARNRSHKKKGVTGASQLRYVSYFGAILNAKKRPTPRRLKFQKLALTSVPNFSRSGGCKPLLCIYNTSKLPMVPLFAEGDQRLRQYTNEDDGLVMWDFMEGAELFAEGDILIMCYHVGADGDKKIMFRIAFHTAFVDAGVLILSVDDLDDAAKNRTKFGENFQVQIIFEATSSRPTQEIQGEFAFNSEEMEGEDDATSIYLRAFSSRNAAAPKITFGGIPCSPEKPAALSKKSGAVPVMLKSGDIKKVQLKPKPTSSSLSSFSSSSSTSSSTTDTTTGTSSNISASAPSFSGTAGAGVVSASSRGSPAWTPIRQASPTPLSRPLSKSNRSGGVGEPNVPFGLAVPQEKRKLQRRSKTPPVNRMGTGLEDVCNRVNNGSSDTLFIGQGHHVNMSRPPRPPREASVRCIYFLLHITNQITHLQRYRLYSNRDDGIYIKIYIYIYIYHLNSFFSPT